MSTKSKNPLLKRVRVHVTQEIMNTANPTNIKGCYFYHAVLPLLKEEYASGFSVGVDQFVIDYTMYPLRKKAEKYIRNGIGFSLGQKPMPVPTSFDVWILRKFLK